MSDLDALAPILGCLVLAVVMLGVMWMIVAMIVEESK